MTVLSHWDWQWDIRSYISWVCGELAEDKSPSFRQQGLWTTINHCSIAGG